MINSPTKLSRKLRILLCPGAYYPSFGGVEEITRLLAAEYSAMGHTVAIAVNRWPSEASEYEELWGIPVHRFNLTVPSKRNFVELWQVVPRSSALNQFVSNWQPDVIHVICPSFNSIYLWLSQLKDRRKLVLTLQGELFMDQHQTFQRSAFARWCIQQLLSVTDSITGCSQYVIDHASKMLRLPSVPQSVVFNGVQIDEPYTPFDAQRRRYIFAIGRVVQNKGFDLLINAFSQVAVEFNDVDLILAGDGDQLPTLRQQAADLSLENRVKFIGRQDRPAVGGLYAGCQFFVLPSPLEPFGIVCLEAMRAGKAVIATDAGGPREFIENGANGLLVPPSSVPRLADAIKLLLKDDGLRARLGSEAAARVQNFSWKSISEKYMEVYTSVISTAVPR